MPNTEEFSRILVWILGAFAGGFGFATPDALFAIVQPEVIGAVMVVFAAIWRAFRPPVA